MEMTQGIRLLREKATQAELLLFNSVSGVWAQSGTHEVAPQNVDLLSRLVSTDRVLSVWVSQNTPKSLALWEQHMGMPHGLMAARLCENMKTGILLPDGQQEIYWNINPGTYVAAKNRYDTLRYDLRAEFKRRGYANGNYHPTQWVTRETRHAGIQVGIDHTREPSLSFNCARDGFADPSITQMLGRDLAYYAERHDCDPERVQIGKSYCYLPAPQEIDRSKTMMLEEFMGLIGWDPAKKTTLLLGNDRRDSRVSRTIPDIIPIAVSDAVGGFAEVARAHSTGWVTQHPNIHGVHEALLEISEMIDIPLSF